MSDPPNGWPRISPGLRRQPGWAELVQMAGGGTGLPPSLAEIVKANRGRVLVRIWCAGHSGGSAKLIAAVFRLDGGRALLVSSNNTPTNPRGWAPAPSFVDTSTAPAALYCGRCDKRRPAVDVTVLVARARSTRRVDASV